MEIIVMTCDRNAWVLAIFFHLFEKLWPDCPWPVKIVGGLHTPDDLGYSVYTADDSGWCRLLLGYLTDKQEDDFVLIFCEDYVIMGRVDTKRITCCLRLIEADHRVQFVRLNAVPGPSLPWIPDLAIGEFDKGGGAYLGSLVPTIFRVAHLRRLLELNWSAWDVEIAGTEKARTLPGTYLGSTETLIPCHNFLQRGKVNPAAAKEVQEKW